MKRPDLLSEFRRGWESYRASKDREGGVHLLGWHFAERYAADMGLERSDLRSSSDHDLSRRTLDLAIERALVGQYAAAVRKADAP